MGLSADALVFGLGYLRGPKSKLSFGGEGAQMAITPRARAALNELLVAGYAEPAEPDDQIKGREHYQGTMQDPFMGDLAKASGIDFFGDESRWPSFSKISDGPRPNATFTMTTRNKQQAKRAGQ